MVKLPGLRSLWLSAAAGAALAAPVGARAQEEACAGCHGENGRTESRPGSVNERAFLSLLSPQVLRRLIITGRPDLKMPDYADRAGRPRDFKPLTSQQIADLVALLTYWRDGGAMARRSCTWSKTR